MIVQALHAFLNPVDISIRCVGNKLAVDTGLHDGNHHENRCMYS